MTKGAVFTVEVEADLHAAFLAEAEAVHRPAGQLVMEYMRDFIAQRQAERERDVWFQGKVEEALRQADDPTVARIPHEHIADDWQRERADLVEKAAKGRR